MAAVMSLQIKTILSYKVMTLHRRFDALSALVELLLDTGTVDRTRGSLCLSDDSLLSFLEILAITIPMVIPQ